MTAIASHLRHARAHRDAVKVLRKRFTTSATWQIRIPCGGFKHSDGPLPFKIPIGATIKTFDDVVTSDRIVQIKVPAGEIFIVPSNLKCGRIS